MANSAVFNSTDTRENVITISNPILAWKGSRPNSSAGMYPYGLWNAIVPVSVVDNSFLNVIGCTVCSSASSSDREARGRKED